MSDIRLAMGILAELRCCVEVGVPALWETKTHDRGDVGCTSGEDELWCGHYEVCVKHFETNLQTIAAGLSLSMTIIGPRHLGQRREGPLDESSEHKTGVINSNRRQMPRSAVRWEFAMKPKCRIRTNPFGST